MLGILGLLLSMAVFVILSFRNWNIAASAIIAGAIVIITSGIDPADGFFNIFSSGFGSFASGWWSMFTAGAVFGKAIQDCGTADSIVKVFLRLFRGNALLVTLLLSLFMSYGGIGTFIIAFSVYPIARALFEKEGISSDLLPAAILFCPTTLAMTMLPGSPSIQNVIPTNSLGTTIYAGPLLGAAASVFTFILGYLYLRAVSKKSGAKSTGYLSKDADRPNIKDLLALLPCGCLWIISFVLISMGTDSNTAEYQNDKLEFIKNPIIAEFLGLAYNTDFSESDLEKRIITNLQKFLMELGKGYAFVARQQHIKTEKQDYFIDLVFYNYILKCFVLVDLKTSKVTHQDVGQMDMYVRMYDELKRSEGDNPTIGIVLCSETDEDIAKYSVLHGNEQLFASKYKLYLPTEEELRNEIEMQKAIFILQQQDNEQDEQ